MNRKKIPEEILKEFKVIPFFSFHILFYLYL